MADLTLSDLDAIAALANDTDAMRAGDGIVHLHRDKALALVALARTIAAEQQDITTFNGTAAQQRDAMQRRAEAAEADMKEAERERDAARAVVEGLKVWLETRLAEERKCLAWQHESLSTKLVEQTLAELDRLSAVAKQE